MKIPILMFVAMTFATDTRVIREAKTLTQSGFDVRILCWDRQGRRPPNEIINNCKVRNMKFGRTSPLPYPKLYFVIAALLFQVSIILWVLKSGKSRVILHAHDFNTLIGCVIAKKLLRERPRLVYDSHELTPGLYYEWYGSFIASIVTRLENAALKEVDGVIAANEAILSHLKRSTSVPGIVIYNCPSARTLPRVPRNEAKKRLHLADLFVVLYSGKIRQDFDLDMILRTARELKRLQLTHFKFVFVGLSDVQEISSLRKRIENEGIQDMIDFRNWVSNERWLLYYLASELCFAVTRRLGPSTEILTPNRIFESMSCSVPVVVRGGTLAAQLIQRWNCGLVVSSEEDFIEKLLSAHKDKRKMVELGRAGNRAFRVAYNWEIMADRLAKLYKDLHVFVES